MPKGEERDAAVLTIFKNAAAAGYVDTFFVKKMHTVLATWKIRKIFQNAIRADGKVNIDLLPREWRRNADTTVRRNITTTNARK